MIHNGPKLSKMVQNGPKVSKMVQPERKWSKMYQNVSKQFKIVQNYPEWLILKKVLFLKNITLDLFPHTNKYINKNYK